MLNAKEILKKGIITGSIDKEPEPSNDKEPKVFNEDVISNEPKPLKDVEPNTEFSELTDKLPEPLKSIEANKVL